MVVSLFWTLQAPLPGFAASSSSSSSAGGGAAVAAPAAATAAFPAAAAAASSAAPCFETPLLQANQQQQFPRPPGPAADAAFLTSAAIEGMPDIKLRIWTLGLRFAHLAPLAAGDRAVLTQVAHDHAKNRRAVPAYWPAAFLRSGGWSTSPNEITIALDTRCFSDPAQRSGWHLGFHGSVQQGMVQSRRQDFRLFFCICSLGLHPESHW